LLAHRDPARSADPRVRELVAQLAQLPPAPAPRGHFRAELRAQLVAVTPRLVATGPEVPVRTTARSWRTPAGAATTATLLRRLASVRAGRPIAVAVGVLCVFALLLGGAVWISDRAIPGDTLYTVKRATENARLALAGSDTEKAKDYLSFAKTRAAEVAKLLGQPAAAAAAGGSIAAGFVSVHTAKLVGTTLDSADGDVRNASRLLTRKAVGDRATAPLSVLIGWAPGQLARLRHIAARLPSGPVLDRVRSSTQLVQAALTRAEQLRSNVACACLAGAPSDQLGPVPCTACTPRVPVQGPAGTAPPASSPASSTARRPAQPNAPGATSTTAPGQAPLPGGARSGSSGSTSTGSAIPPAAGNSPRDPGHQRSSTSAAQPGAGGPTGGATSTPAGGSQPSSSGAPSPSGAPSSPQPSRTCLIVLLGICL
jgi:hypothetical protein